MAKFATPFGFSAEGFVPGGEAGLESFFARPPYEQQFIREQGRSPTRSESETGVYDVTPKSPFDLTPGAWYEGMPTPDPYNVQGNIIHAGLSPEIESRIQQDASRGLFDVNERSVAQLGPLTGQSNWKPLTGTSKLIVDALTEGRLKGDPADMARGREDLIRRRARIPSFRPFIGKGGLTAAAIASSLFSPRAEAPMLAPRRDYPDKTHPLQGQAIAFSDEDSPFRQQLPHNLFPPGYLRERAGRNAVEGVRQNLLGNLGLLPSTTSGALTPQELFKQRNDAEELRIREGSLPVIPEVPEWNPQASIPLDFRVNERSMAALSPSVTYTPPPRSLGGSLNAIGQLSRLDPRIADKYITKTTEGPVPTALLESLIPTVPWKEGAGGDQAEGRPRYVETFAEPRTTWTPPTPPAPAITKALKSFTASRDTGEAQRNREQDKRERALEQAADNRRKNEEKARLESARNKKSEQARINKENRERKAEEQRIASKQAKEEKQRRALEKQMEDMLRHSEEAHNAYLRRKAQEEERRRRAGYGVGAMYT